MIQGLTVREIHARLKEEGMEYDVWDAHNAPGPGSAASYQLIFPGAVEAWIRRDQASERVICLGGMLKLVLCDRRQGSPSQGEVMELFLGEYRLREVLVPAGVLRGWKAVGNRPALVLLVLEGDGAYTSLSLQGADVPYDWDIVMH